MELTSRYGDKYLLNKVSDCEYEFSAPNYTRIIYGDEKGTIISALDPPGGPMIGVGSKLEDKTIKEIKLLEIPEGVNFLIIVED